MPLAGAGTRPRIELEAYMDNSDFEKKVATMKTRLDEMSSLAQKNAAAADQLMNKGTASDSMVKSITDIRSAYSMLLDVVRAGKAVWDFAEEGAQLQRLSDAGSEMARQFGSNMDDIVSKVQEASLGTVSEMDIISSANKSMMLGVTADADQMANLMEVAAFRGRAMGVSTTQAFDDIVRGIGRASPMILDNLGIVINAKETYANYAESIGKTAGELTKAEKTQALLNAVLNEGNKMLDKAGGLAEDNASKFEKLSAVTADLGNQFKETFSAGVLNFIYGNEEKLSTLTESTNAFAVANAEQAAKLREVYEAQKLANEAQFTGADSFSASENAIITHTEALGENVSAIEMDEEAIKELTKSNEDYLSMVGNITNQQQDFSDKMDELGAKRAEVEGQLQQALAAGWQESSDKVQGYREKLAELDSKMEETATAQEEATNRMILSMLQQQLAVDGLSSAEMNYLLQTGVEWGVYSQSAVLQAQKAIDKANELENEFNNLPTEKTMTIYMNTQYGAASISQEQLTNRGRGAGVQEHAAGGSFLIPMSYGNEGFKMGSGDTASGGERVTITPKGQAPAGFDMGEFAYIISNELGRIMRDYTLAVR